MGNTGSRTHCLCQGWRYMNFSKFHKHVLLFCFLLHCDLVLFVTHRWANPRWAMSWTVLRLRCPTSLLHSLPGEPLTFRTLMWTMAVVSKEIYTFSQAHQGHQVCCISVFFFSSVGEREDWFHTLSRAIADHAAGLCTFGGPCSEVGKITSV